MEKKLKDLIKPYTPFFIIIVYRFFRRCIKKFLYYICRISVDKSSEIYPLLKENWRNYKTDLYPQDRRMSILREKNVRGMSTENIRFSINEIVRRFAKDGVYLEVGTLYGCSLLAAALFNYSTRCIGIDNFSQFDPEGRNEFILKKNLEEFNNPSNIEFYNQDYKVAIQDLFFKEPTLEVNVYYYDGEHSFENQMEGLNIMLPHLAHKCIILVDDINWEWVEKANKCFIKANPNFKSVFKIRTKSPGSTDWWTGFEIIARDL